MQAYNSSFHALMLLSPLLIFIINIRSAVKSLITVNFIRILFHGNYYDITALFILTKFMFTGPMNSMLQYIIIHQVGRDSSDCVHFCEVTDMVGSMAMHGFSNF